MAIVHHTAQKKICATDIKNALCAYFYKKRRCIYFCKEHYLHRFDMRADFIALFSEYENLQRQQRVMEIEVKISWSDFIRDFKDKEPKHNNYLGKTPSQPYVNYFAFCVPLEMYDRCKEYLDKHYPKYGLFIYSDGEVIQGRGSMFSKKRLLTDIESPITKNEIVNQMAIHIVYQNKNEQTA